jgi:phosphocarrier protein HPr
MPNAKNNGWDAERLVVLTNRYGLHMRPSKELVQMANRFPCEIVVEAEGQEVDAKSILGLIGLGAECGASVAVRARGERAGEAVKEIVEMLESLPELHGEPREAPGGAGDCSDRPGRKPPSR